MVCKIAKDKYNIELPTISEHHSAALGPNREGRIVLQQVLLDMLVYRWIYLSVIL